MGKRKRTLASQRICERLLALPAYQQATVVAVFYPMPEEVDIWPAIQHGWKTHKTLAFPRVSNSKQREMCFHRVDNRSSFIAGYHNIMEPPVTAPVISAQDVDFAIVPALAVDEKKYRLGYGGGFYDKFLARLKNAISCAPVFLCQQVPLIVCEAHDMTVDIVIAE